MAEDTAGRAMSDEDLVSWLSTRVKMASGVSESRLSRERERLGRYYDGLEPKPLHAGNSKYVSQDVYDSVESMKATLLETFTGNAKPVQFAPTGAKDVEEARIATEYSNYVVFRQNAGYSIFHDVIQDGLMARVGIAQAYWKKDVAWIEEETAPTTLDGASYVIQQHLASGIDTRNRKIVRHGDGTVSLSYEKKVDRSQVILEAVPPEEFGISPRAKDIETAEVVYRTCAKAKSDLIKAGYAKAVVEDIWNDESVWQDTNPEVVERFQAVDDAAYLGLNDELQDARRTIRIYEVYCNLDMDGTGVSELYKVTYGGNRILDKERVSRKPFLVFVPLPRAHSFWGNSFGEKLIPIQNAKTLLERSVIDHAVITTNPRYQVVRGGLVNPKELLENRIGGIVNVMRDGAVTPLMQAPLNPFIFQTMQKMDDDKEQVSAISKLSQGLNKDVISKQNSADMVQTMMGTSQTRQKVIARNFANGFLKDLILMVYQLVIENETQAKIVEVAGNYVQIDPENWAERRDVTVEFAVGYGEADKEAQKWATIHAGLAAMPALQASYGAPQQFAVAKKFMQAKGIPDVETYLLPPAQAPKPDPAVVQLHQALAQIPLREIAVKEGKLKLDTAKVQGEQGRKTNEVSLKATREGLSADHNDAKLQLEREKFVHDMVVDAAEIELQRQAQTISASPEPKG